MIFFSRISKFSPRRTRQPRLSNPEGPTTPRRHCSPISDFHRDLLLKVTYAQAGCLWPSSWRCLRHWWQPSGCAHRLRAAAGCLNIQQDKQLLGRSKELLRSSCCRHTLDIFFPMQNEEQNICLHPFPFLLGTLVPTREGVCKANSREVTSFFLYLPVVSLNITLNLCSNILQRH